MPRIRDVDIRNALHNELKSMYRYDQSTVIVDELGILQGVARVDIAVVNGVLAAYEIKSESDSLARLPRQLDYYSEVFDYVTLVVSPSHLENARAVVPDWWGIVSAEATKDGRISFRLVQPPKLNGAVNARSVVQLLWRSEALEFLAEIGADRGVKSRTRGEIWDRVCSVYGLDAIRERVRICLKRRKAQRLPPSLS